VSRRARTGNGTNAAAIVEIAAADRPAA
jgi:hypothetical protein